MTFVAILFFCGFLASLSAVLIQLCLSMRRGAARQQVVWNASARIHDVADQALRRMLEEALQAMLANQRLQGPQR